MNAVKPAAQKIGLLSRGSFRSALPAACVVPFPVTQDRSIHSTTRCESNPLFIGTAVAVAALTTRYTLQAWEAYKNRPVTARKPNFRGYYKGGFEDKMSKREAALILGVRESASRDRIRERHRQLLMLNHPDTGGSTFIASKINEAKDLLLGKVSN